MPAGETHERLQLIAAPILTVSSVPVAALVADDFGQAACIVFGSLLGSLSAIILTPDLADVDGDTLPEARIRSVPILGWVVATIYDGLSRLIPHRGISHTPIIGTAINMLVLWPLFFVWISSGGSWCLPIAWFVSKCLADLVHIVADILVTDAKRAINQHRKKRGDFWN